MSVVIVTLFIIHVDIIRFLFFISNETMRCGSLMILKMAAKLMKNQGFIGVRAGISICNPEISEGFLLQHCCQS